MPESAPWKESITVGAAAILALGAAGCSGDSKIIPSKLVAPLSQGQQTYTIGTKIQLECTNEDKQSFGAHVLPESSFRPSTKVNPLPIKYVPKQDAQNALTALSLCTRGLL